MTQSEARNILPGCLIQPWHPDQFKDAQENWLKLCLPYTGRIQPLDDHIAALDLGQHPVPYDIAVALIDELMAAVKLPLRYGAGPTKWVSRLASEHFELVRSVADPPAFVAPYPIEELAPVSAASKSRLKDFGYHTIGTAAHIPFSVLQQQFQAEALTVRNACLGGGLDPVQPLYPRGVLHESIRFEGEVENAEVINDALRRLASLLGERLSGQQAGQIDLVLDFEESRSFTINRRLPRPIAATYGIYSILRILVEPALKQSTAPIAGIQCRLADLTPAGYRQKQLFTTESKIASEFATRSVRMALGNDSVVLGRHIKQSRRALVLQEWKNATGWR